MDARYKHVRFHKITNGTHPVKHACPKHHSANEGATSLTKRRAGARVQSNSAEFEYRFQLKRERKR